MCLVAKTGEILTAEEDISTFKVLLLAKQTFNYGDRELTKGKYYTPYQFRPVPLDITQRLRKKLIIKEKNVFDGFHSCLEILKAEAIIQGRNDWRMFNNYTTKCNLMVMKAIIPKGARYIIGIRDDVVSTSLRVTKEKVNEL